jgi:Fe-S oxidoreductase
VAYFVDVYANYYDHELAESVVAVLQQAEVNVLVPQRQRSSGNALHMLPEVPQRLGLRKDRLMTAKRAAFRRQVEVGLLVHHR